jgi:flagellar hook-length control protein FliK
MNASLTTLLLATDSSAASSGSSNNIQINQLVGVDSGDFAPLLQQAREGVVGGDSVDTLPFVDVEAARRQLHSLPQGGKLLPLLKQLLNDSASQGVPAQQVLKQLATRLEQLRSAGELDPNEAVGIALHQLLNQSQVAKTPTYSETLSTPDSGGELLQTPRAGAEAPGRERSQPQPTFQQSLAAPEADVQGDEQTSNTVSREFKVPVLERNSGLLQLPLQQTEQRRASEAVSALLKRVPAGTRTTAADNPLRLESLAATFSAATTPPSPAVSSGLPTVSIDTPFNQPNWGQSLGERIQWMVGQKMQGAQLKLNPAHLGPLEVRIQVQNDQASVQFTSTHAIVRETLEAALPRLRDMLESSGVELVDVDVSGQSFAEQRRSAGEGESETPRSAVFDAEIEPEAVVEAPLAAVQASGRLDLFA